MTRFLPFGLLLGWLALAAATPCAAMFEGTFLYFPSHSADPTDLQPWKENDEIVGYASVPATPRYVWLLCHGNGGQASLRGYVKRCLPEGHALHVLEYPGYGLRAGKPSRRSINTAAEEALAALRRRYPNTPIGVAGESLGTGPACHLASLKPAPDRVVLFVPYDNLLSVAKRHYPYLPVGLFMRDRWDNVAALSGYQGRVDIYAARQDEIIPVEHARRLAATLRNGRYYELDCTHNEWSRPGLVKVLE